MTGVNFQAGDSSGFQWDQVAVLSQSDTTAGDKTRSPLPGCTAGERVEALDLSWADHHQRLCRGGGHVFDSFPTAGPDGLAGFEVHAGDLVTKW